MPAAGPTRPIVRFLLKFYRGPLLVRVPYAEGTASVNGAVVDWFPLPSRRHHLHHDTCITITCGTDARCHRRRSPLANGYTDPSRASAWPPPAAPGAAARPVAR